ncbi:purine-nucleoside phosphorylase [Phreatobacter sp.]|uniref:purine-nucleoside phosphorylase n=1 Tax=Phreatobacter sp. TaxID=1966341 RepID=UPI0025DE1078|nr:purine-nucleoside phosphorylase [Phreatobacter sp.]
MTAARIIRTAAGEAPIACAIILGTGLGPLAEALEDARVIPYGDLPGFPPVGVSGHAGRLVVGTLEGCRVAVLQGRAHTYENGDPRVMKPVIDTLAALAIPRLLVTNAAGSLKPDMLPGSIMAIEDHIALFGPNPLIGQHGDGRFVPMNGAYDPVLRRAIAGGAARRHVALFEGIYVWVTGPSFETPAEIRALRTLGADAVGMSTVPEVILARHAGIAVAGLSLITNLAAGLAPDAPSHAETKTVAAAGAAAMEAVIRGFLVEIGRAEARHD